MKNKRILLILFAVLLAYHFSFSTIFSILYPLACSGLATTVIVTPRTEIPSFATVFSFCVGEKFMNMSELVLHNHRSYASRHNYEFIEGSPESMPHINFIWPTVWLKAALAWQLLNQRSTSKWFIWVDCDALYVNLDESLPALLVRLNVNNESQIVVAKDIVGSSFNTGVVLIRNSAWSRNFYSNILRVASQKNEVRYHLADVDAGGREQPVWHKLYMENKRSEKKAIQVSPLRSPFLTHFAK